MRQNDQYTRQWIIDNSLKIIKEYKKGILTLRALHYQLVSIGMTNTIQHYKRVVAAMTQARWEGLVDFDTFSDLDRQMVGSTEYEVTDVDDKIESGKGQVRAWINTYYKNRWENQEFYIEVFIEKKALQGVFQDVCMENAVALGACKGYPSLTFLNEAKLRFEDALRAGKTPIILYFGDYDPSGEDIPRSIRDNLQQLGVDVSINRIALLEGQVKEWNLPPAPAKVTDSRSVKWTGLGQVELDAVKPEKLQSLCREAIDDLFDEEAYLELMDQEEQEGRIYREELINYVRTL